MPKVWLSVAAPQEYQVVLQCTGALPAAGGRSPQGPPASQKNGEGGVLKPTRNQEGLGSPVPELPGTIAQ